MIMASSSPPNLQADPAVPENTTNHTCHPHPLQCPRCNSSNTKFCYYNNYSFSQPRHFCKACKRYWTRGGTLRNVPVGGGCRKNKRTKPQASIRDSYNPLFYPSNINSPFPSFRSTRVFGDHNNTGFDFQPQVNGLGLGFSSGIMAAANDSGGIDQGRFGWNPDPNPNTYRDQINYYYYYSETSSIIGAWFDQTNSNIGSSVPSLI